MANFFDPETNEEFTITRYRTVMRNGNWINVDLTGKQLVNPINGNVLEVIPKEGIPTLLKSNDKATLQKMLKKRSHDHFKKEIEEQKHEKLKQVTNQK